MATYMTLLSEPRPGIGMFRCICGKEKEVRLREVRRGQHKSCGCKTRAIISEHFKTHGLSNCRVYKIWQGMMGRCYNPRRKCYPNYGGRGIKVCESWQSFENFFADMGHPPCEMSLDRIDNDLDYSPDNCRWVEQRAQCNNTRRNVYVEIEGVIKSQTEWCREFNINLSTVRTRVAMGWSWEKALRTPLLKKKKDCRKALLSDMAKAAS